MSTHRTHKWKSRTYTSWANMIDRCLNKNAPNYRRYGKRGIAVCRRWRMFANFLADMGERPAGLTLGRIDNSKGYEPRNCKWVSMREQANNTRRNVRLQHDGKTMTMSEWAREIGLDPRALRRRLVAGWSVARALSTPNQRRT
jgi:hypothetical protein